MHMTVTTAVNCTVGRADRYYYTASHRSNIIFIRYFIQCRNMSLSYSVTVHITHKYTSLQERHLIHRMGFSIPLTRQYQILSKSAQS